MSRMILADQKARDRFTEALESNVCISASAGAGKTRAIVDRVEALIRCPLADGQADPLERLVVVTYGEMAAQELKVRCRQRLLEADDSPHLKNRMLARFNLAYFGTIHSFCLRLIRDFGSDLGLPGQVRLLSQSDRVFFERFKQDLDLNTLDWPEDQAGVVLKYYSIEQIFSIAEGLSGEEAADFIRRGGSWMEVPDVAPLLEFPVQKRSINTIGRIQRGLKQWQEDEKNGQPFLYIPPVKSGGAAFVEAGKAILDPYREWLAQGAVVLAAHISEAFRKYRLSNLRLTYDDMIAETRRLAQEPGTLDRMRERGWIIILDEAQDTDAVMFQILTEIARPAGAAIGSWPDDRNAAGPQPGQFCFVGDDQQCIYSSRADIGRYLDYVQAYAEGRGGERLEFTVTMRCPEPVVAGVNRIFPGRIHQSRAKFRLMDASPLRDAETSGVIRLPWALGLEGKVDDLMYFEAECREVAGWMKSNGLEGLGVREWSEVAVLCPRVSWLRVVGSALEEAGIPVAHKSTRQVAAERALYTWPYALFHVMAYPFDRFELIGVLRDIFVIRDAEIEKLHREDPEGLNLFSGERAEGDLQGALRFLEAGHVDLMGRRGMQTKVPWSRTVRRLAAEAGLAARLEALGEEAEGLARFYHSVDEASASGLSLMEWLDEERVKLEESAPPVATLGGVDLITCHKAKGLEWEVVVLPGLWRKIGERGRSYPSVQRQGGKLRVLVDGESAGEEWKLRAERLRDEEYQRLLYVAMTRSKKLLVISDPDVKAKRRTPNFFDLISWNEVRGEFSGEMPESGMAPAVDSHSVVLPEATEEERQCAVAWSREIPRRVLPHALCEQEDRPLETYEPGWDEKRVEPGVGGVEYGLIWHEWVERIPWSGISAPNGLEAYCEKSLSELKKGGMNERHRGRLEAEVALFRASEMVAELIFEGECYLAELPFLWPSSPSVWMEGVMDLVVRMKSGRWRIIDWKTNRPQKSETKEAFQEWISEHYRPQLKAYADVCRQHCGDAEIRTGLYLTVTGNYLEL